MRILQRSSLATLLCLINEIAVTRVSMAEANSPLAASWKSDELGLSQLRQKRGFKALKPLTKATEWEGFTWTALAMAELETVRFLLIISSNSGSERPWGT